MTSGDGPLEPSLNYPPVVRQQASPARTHARLPDVRLPGDLRLSTVAVASGLALAFEGLRLLARSRSKRSASRQAARDTAHVTVSYEWTQVIYERHERF
jgi:hypothetical protein